MKSEWDKEYSLRFSSKEKKERNVTNDESKLSQMRDEDSSYLKSFSPESIVKELKVNNYRRDADIITILY